MVNPLLADREAVYALLESVKDPEIPVISVVELGIVRDVEVGEDGSGVRVVITPTYSGCPAMREMEADIREALVQAGFTTVDVEVVLSPAWTTEWMCSGAREKLRNFGIAPPGPVTGDDELISLTRSRKSVSCPYCGSENTELKSSFGSTACKAIHVCNACHQPFDEFKPI